MKKTISLILALFLLLSLCACGSAPGDSAKAAAGSYMVAEEAAWPAEEPMAETSMAYDSVNGLSPAGAPQTAGAAESAPAHHIHDALILFRTFRYVSVRPILLQLV